MFGISVSELILILILGLVVLGPGKLPQIGKAVGKRVIEFKQAASGMMNDDGSQPASGIKAQAIYEIDQAGIAKTGVK